MPSTSNRALTDQQRSEWGQRWALEPASKEIGHKPGEGHGRGWLKAYIQNTITVHEEDWYTEQPDLFVKRPRDHPGCDT
jgi:hypothetical protein